ncbi:DUF4269 domain-containing protein [Sinorhizobium sp. 7-81]|uniref:DUF4269 domain-containing protein n=1 Tax=Sinorhizobium sp. 8-89 TaxID=3049089 RepID=UPI0024C43884|nr:DUF4269 domain-containing protein [Sinorhizobium sp. 8-89]MDK1491273.1 DUF4269 domain-containing protein [Sinorhizobium sp. 8-89]
MHLRSELAEILPEYLGDIEQRDDIAAHSNEALSLCRIRRHREDVEIGQIADINHAEAQARWGRSAFEKLLDEGDRSRIIRQWTGRENPIIASFAAADWTFELFGHAVPVSEQHGWKHFQVEHRLLTIGGSRFRAAVMRLRDDGMKTEPAFAATLALEASNPYQALLEMAGWSDEALAALLRERGF